MKSRLSCLFSLLMENGFGKDRALVIYNDFIISRK